MPEEPNAVCPVCGAAVYYWKNERGSKVWFDAIGYPWPKHPCLDVRSTGARSDATTEAVRTHLAEGPLRPPLRVDSPNSSSASAAGCGCLLISWFLVVPVISGIVALVAKAGFPASREEIQAVVGPVFSIIYLILFVKVILYSKRNRITRQAQAALNLSQRGSGGRKQ